jgi:cell division protein FtsW (lipid II flippase)
MKKNISLQAKKVFNRAALFIAALALSFYSFAQEKKVDIDINTKSQNDNFLMQPWVWVVGGAVFILLLIALLRGNNSKK